MHARWCWSCGDAAGPELAARAAALGVAEVVRRDRPRQG